MKLKNIEEIEAFKEAIANAKHDVFLISTMGDHYNLKSTLSEYIALGELVKNHGNNLELFCTSKEDEPLFLEFFCQFPETT